MDWVINLSSASRLVSGVDPKLPVANVCYPEFQSSLKQKRGATPQAHIPVDTQQGSLIVNLGDVIIEVEA